MRKTSRFECPKFEKSVPINPIMERDDLWDILGMSINDLGLFGLPKDKPVLSKLRKMVKKERFDLKKEKFRKTFKIRSWDLNAWFFSQSEHGMRGRSPKEDDGCHTGPSIALTLKIKGSGKLD